MRIDDGRMRRLVSDLGLNVRYEKGLSIPVRNCWHFMTDGNAVDALFRDKDDFQFGMNLTYLLSISYNVIILAFTLMDTHVHFIIYGELNECKRMMHEYVRRVAIYIANKYELHDIFEKDPLQYQVIDDDAYLKTAICYVIKNAPVAGLQFNAWDYPWSSGPLYFRSRGFWNSLSPESSIKEIPFSTRQFKSLFHAGISFSGQNAVPSIIRMSGDIVYPGEYVAWEIVEKIFRTNKSYNYFLGRSKESDVESKDGIASYLTIPLQELRQHKAELCQELFGTESVKKLDTSQRLKLARVLRAKYNSSKKQIARTCGLSFAEVESLL